MTGETETISREEAHRLIDEADSGLLTVINSEPVPCIGTVPIEEREIEISTELYRFGEGGRP